MLMDVAYFLTLDYDTMRERRRCVVYGVGVGKITTTI